jgi:NADH-quinone oxidoreductase subunit H
MPQISSPAVSAYYSAIYGALAPSVASQTTLTILSLLLSLIAFAVIMTMLFTIFSLMFAWAERKLVARAQSRRGPTYVGKYGLLQNLADLFKLMSKESITPASADKPLFKTVLPALMALSMAVLAFIPMNGAFVGMDTTLGMLAIFVMLSFSPMLLFIAGWSSGNKYAAVAAHRSIVMLASYEIPMVLVVVAVAALANSYGMSAIVGMQQHMWFAFLMPIGFIVFFVVLLAELGRPPFDLDKADSELIGGRLTDAPAPYYGLALLLDYTRLFVGALLVSELFLGGWNSISIIPQFLVLIVKVVLVALLVVLIRAATVRMKVDRALRLGWLYLMPLAVANLLITFVLFVR